MLFSGACAPALWADNGVHRASTGGRTHRPRPQQVDQEVAAEARGEHLGDDVEVGDQGGLQDDGDVGGVEQLDGVGVVLTTVAGRLDGQVYPEALNYKHSKELVLLHLLTLRELLFMHQNIFYLKRYIMVYNP